jgi:hypothetical protein
MMKASNSVRLFWCVGLVLALSAAGHAQNDERKDSKDTKRPSFSVKAAPHISIAPARVVASAELKGGPDDYEEYYCPTVEWEWGDGTKSQTAVDCEPFEAGKSTIKRRFTADHTYHMASNYRIQVRLKRGNKTLVGTSTTVQVRPGLREPIIY